jgi:ABC-type lipoprotein export system ATPase subunit
VERGNTTVAALYDVRNVDFDYPLGNQSVPALRGINLEIAAGDFVCLAGPSGSGKSTLLNILGLIESVQQGTVRFMDESLEDLKEAQKNRIRKFHLGFIFQQFHLLPVLNASENVEYFLIRQGVPRAERKERVRAALEAVGIWDQRAKRPFEMSGGQRQRVAVARAIAKQPRVIIADEPTASLDQQNGRGILEIIRTLNRESEVTVIMASHDQMVLRMVETLVRLRDGQIADVIAQPSGKTPGAATDGQETG